MLTPQPDPPRRMSLRSVPVLTSIWVGLAFCIALGAAMLVRHLHDRDMADCTEDLSSYALMLSAHMESSFTILEAMQDGILEQLRGEDVSTEPRFLEVTATAVMHRSLATRVSSIPYIGGVTLIDRRGILVNSTYYWPMPYRDLSDRAYFRILSTSKLDRYVTEPLQNRANGQWTVYVARRISAPDGEFLGILLGEINFPHFRSFFAEVAPQPDVVVSMFHLDGTMLVRQPQVAGVIGTAPTTGAFRLLAQGLDQGTLRNVSPVDGVDRLIAVHRLPHYPMMISISRSVGAVLHQWVEQRRYIFGIGLLLEAALAATMLLLMRHIKHGQRLAELEGSLVKAQIDKALAAEYARFNVAVNAMTQGLCMLDGDRRLIISNPRFAKIFALPPAALTSGTSLPAIMRQAIKSRAVTLRDMRLLEKALTREARPKLPLLTMWDVEDGRSLSVSLDRMPDKGWLITFADVTERRRTEAQIAHMARHDGLTGLANRLQFHERLAIAVALATRGTPHGVLCLDLDHFKTVNDTLGHPTGDALLQAVTTRLKRCCRETDVIARLGGDEFAIILPLMQDVREAGSLAERLIRELSLPFDLTGHQVVIGCSIGIAFTPHDAADTDTLLKCADLALYRAKADGRNCFRFFESTMDAALQRRRSLESDLRRALANEEFEVFYQPLIETQSGHVSAFEALLRWHRPDDVAIGPSEFIPVAEEMGLILPLGKWTLETACREAVTWPRHIAVAVNISPAQFRSRNFVAMVRDILEKCGLAPHRLELEITEGLLLHDVTETVSTLYQLRALGIRVSMDDFGTGYSSLSYLLKFPFDKVKLDRSFVTDLGNGGQRDVIIEAVTAMCQALGMQTAGEGVETEGQLAFLRAHNCTEVQGFLFSRAIPAHQIPALLADLDPQTLALPAGVH
ncbi:MAG TPA: EAL domain-containing protein [Rhodopila sp.]|nr:EAL domain-containing protein [Rhodopila sp.]